MQTLRDPQPRWSGRLTASLAKAIRPRHRATALAAVRIIHTAIFGSVAACIGIVVWDGLQQRPRRRTVLAGTTVVAESAIYLSNDQVCPLTPLATALGAPQGAVADMLLPDRISRHIPAVSSAAMVVGIALNVVGRRRGESARI